ncbi:hypothetical protein BGZ72_009850 [Mortierella alpina]|nr:hypothetical protein BGZ72_009850 [Mortierella alpina]
MAISFPFEKSMVLESGPFIGSENNRRALIAKFVDDDKDEHLVEEQQSNLMREIVKALGHRSVEFTLQVTGRFTFTPYDSIHTATATKLMKVPLERVTVVAETYSGC